MFPVFSLPILDLHLFQAVSPDDYIWRNTIFAIIQENDHTVWIHGFPCVKVEVFEVGLDVVFEVVLGAILEGFDLFVVGTVLLELCHDFLHVCWDEERRFSAH